jgi:SLT domain-containing protein
VGISSTDRRGSTSDFEGIGSAGTPPDTLNRENSQTELEQNKENEINKNENISKNEGSEDQSKGQTPDQDIAYHSQKQVNLEKQILWFKSDNFYNKEYFEQFKARLNRYFEYEMNHYYELEIPENSLSDDKYKIFTNKAHEIDFQEFENMRERSKEVKK